MSNGSLRRALTAVVVAAACITLSPHADAARNSGALERFVARAVSVEDPTEATRPIDILIERWSTDEEFDALRGSLVQYGPETLLPTLQKTWRRAGVLFTPGVMTTGSRARLRRTENLMFARQINTPTGRQVILAGDRHLQLGEEPARKRPTTYEFTLIDIRLGKDGTGIGKIAPATQVAYNTQTKLLEVKNYPGQSVRLAEVRAEKP